jgi:hypothetical protein
MEKILYQKTLSLFSWAFDGMVIPTASRIMDGEVTRMTMVTPALSAAGQGQHALQPQHLKPIQSFTRCLCCVGRK